MGDGSSSFFGSREILKRWRLGFLEEIVAEELHYVLKTRLFLSSFVLISTSKMSKFLMVGEGRKHKYKHFYFSF